MTRPRYLSRLTLAAVALSAAALSGCKTIDDATFFAFAGETPGSRTPFVDYTVATRLAKSPPGVRLISFRPALTPLGAATGETAAVRTAFANIRQQLSDRDDELRFRRRSLTLYGQEYSKAQAELRQPPGDPLPAYNEDFRQEMRNAHAALNNLEGDLTKMNGTLVRLDANLGTADDVAKRAQALAAGGPEAGTDPTIRPALATAAATTLAAGRKLAAETRNNLAAHVEYISRQREALNRFDAQVQAARGPTPLEQFRATKTVVEWLPRSWRPRGERDIVVDKKNQDKQPDVTKW